MEHNCDKYDMNLYTLYKKLLNSINMEHNYDKTLHKFIYTKNILYAIQKLFYIHCTKKIYNLFNMGDKYQNTLIEVA